MDSRVLKENSNLLPLMVPIIKVVGDFCNLRCSYCFYNSKDQRSRRVMNYQLLEKFLAEYMNLFSGNLTFIWHGGEPLLAGIDFFQKVVDVQKKNLKGGQVIYNAIQTNGTLITREWADFFKKNQFTIGVSLDGDRESHNQFRKDSKDNVSFDLVIKGIKTLRHHEIEPGIIQTLTRHSCDRIKNDFNFLVNILGIKNWSINIYCYDHKIKSLSNNLIEQVTSNDDLITFFKSCVDLWLE